MTDSNSGVAPQEGEERGITGHLMPIIVDGRTFYENVDIFPGEFYRLQAESHHVASSQPSLASIVNMWSMLLESHDGVAYIPMSSSLSGSCEAAEALSQSYDGRVEAVGSHRISAMQRMSALGAKAPASSGCTARAIKAALARKAHDATVYIHR